MRILATVFIATLSLIFASSDEVLAHNSLLTTSPANGEVLTASPAVWSVEFEKVVPLPSASGVLTSTDGVRTEIIPRHGVSGNILLFDLPPQLSGAVTTRWRLVGQDGHVISGRVSFSIALESSAQPFVPDTSSPPPTATDDIFISEEGSVASDTIGIVARFGTFLALAVLGGLLFSHFFIASGSTNTRRGQLVLRSTSLSLVIFPIVVLLLLLNDIRGGSGSLSDAMTTLLSLTVGPMLIIRIVIGIVLAVIISSNVRRKTLDNSMLVQLSALLVMFCVTLAYGGHSRSQTLPWLGVPTDVLHTLAISVWLGGLVALLFFIIPIVSTQQGMIAFVRFGYAAQWAVPVIVATGMIQTLRIHGSVTSLFTSQHGGLLLLKLIFVVIMLLVGNRNRKLVARQINQSNSRATMTRTFLLRASVIEVISGVITLGFSAALVSASLT